MAPTRKVTGVLWLLCTVLSPGKSLAQPEKIAFEHLSLEQGLSQSSVYAIVQDSQGFLWFGTQDGLDRYDGYTFTVFRHNPDDSSSISHNYILRLFIDSQGRMWAGTGGGGLNVYDAATNQFKRYGSQPEDSTSLSDNTVYRIYEDHRGTIWVATQHGLNRLDASGEKFRRFSADPNDVHSLPDDLISCLLDDRQGRLWIGTSKGVCLYDRDADRFTRIPGCDELINSILQSPDGELWFIGSSSFEYDSTRGRLIPMRPAVHGSEQSILNPDGTLLCGSVDGLHHIDPRRHRETVWHHDPADAQSLSENSVISLCRDRSGILWVGTFNGINKYVPTKKKFETYTYNAKNPNSLSSPRVRGFSQDATGAVWIATQDGLNRFDPGTQTFIRYYGPPKGRNELNANHFWGVMVDAFSPAVSVWAVTNGPSINHLTFPPGRDLRHPHVDHYNQTTSGQQNLPNGIVASVYQDRSGDIWFGHLGDGVTKYDRRRGTFSHFQSLANERINAMYEDTRGSLWVGGYTLGLHRLNRERGVFEPFFAGTRFEKSVAGNSTLSMCEEPAGTMWVGTYDGLLEIRDGTVIRTMTDKEGLPNNVIYAILSDRKGNLWMSTNKGIARYTPATGQIRSFDADDGLQSNEFNQGSALRARDGAMYFGGILGFNRFYPDSIRDNPNIPLVVLTDFRIFNKSVVPSDRETRIRSAITQAEEIRVPYYDNVITFSFAALEFTDPAENKYAYRMEGFDKGWVESGTKREATYTNLNPGTYTFGVKASNNDGVWTEEGTSIRIVVEPPWWMTWWFRGLVLVIFLSVGPVVYFRRVSALKKEYARQQEFSRRLIERQESERKRIASELHDSIGQDLLVIKNRTYLATQAKPVPARIKQQLDQIMETVTQSLQNVRRIARNLRPYHLDRVGLPGAIRSMLETASQSSGIIFETNLDAVGELYPDASKDMEVNLYRIVQENVNNILKHSEAKHARVEFQRTDGRLSVVIRDDGKGFDPATVHSAASTAGLGLTGMAERVRILSGTYVVDSRPGTGTTVTIVIPYRAIPS